MYFKIVIIDQSHLAINMYRLLLKEEKVNFLVANSYKDARPWFFKPGKIDLVIINSNIFGSKFEQILEQFLDDQPLQGLPKLFICQDQEKDWQQELKKFSRTKLLNRPFHPDDFLKTSLSMLRKQ